MRVLSILPLLGLLASCDGWPGDPVDDPAELPPPTPRDAGTSCTAISVLLSNATPQVNGAFCFGVATGASEALACVPTAAQDIECADQLLGGAYVVRWTGSQGQVQLARGGAVIATISQREAGVFEIDSTVSQSGVCKVGAAGANRAEFCTFVP